MVESSDKMQSAAEGNGKPLKYSCGENPMNTNGVKKQKDATLKDEPPGQKASNMLLGQSGGQLLIAPEGTERPGQSGDVA